jgi:hypothetical protein
MMAGLNSEREALIGKNRSRPKRCRKKLWSLTSKWEKNGGKLNGKQVEQNILNNMRAEITRFNFRMKEYESKLEKELMERKKKLENNNGVIGKNCEQELIRELWIQWDTDMRIYNMERKNDYKSKGSSGIEENMEKMMKFNLWKIIDMKKYL